MVRPENVVIAPAAQADSAADNVVTGTIDKLSFSGNVVDYFVRVDGLQQPWRAQGTPAQLLSAGQQVQLTFPAAAAYMLPPDSPLTDGTSR